MIDNIESANETTEEDETPVRAFFDKRTKTGRVFGAADSVACALVARARATRLRESGNPVAALVFSHHASRHMLRARCLVIESAA